MDNYTRISSLIENLGLGSMKKPPEAITGGLLHKMYKVTTNTGVYAVKALNPLIMQKAKARRDILESERIASALAVRLPVLSALGIRGTQVQELSGRYYLIYPWIEGRSLKPDEIKASHSIKIGKILSEINKTDLTDLCISRKAEATLNIIDWEYYLQAGTRNNAPWTEKMTEMLYCLYDTNNKAIAALTEQNSEEVISHRDLDPKNVLWQGEEPIIIDWESAGYINPMKDLIGTALYWSEDSAGYIDKERLIAFIQAYNEECKIPVTDWKTVLLSSITDKLSWLEYSLRRSLGIEAADEAEQRLGTVQALLTLNAIEVFLKQVPELESCLSETLEAR